MPNTKRKMLLPPPPRNSMQITRTNPTSQDLDINIIIPKRFRHDLIQLEISPVLWILDLEAVESFWVDHLALLNRVFQVRFCLTDTINSILKLTNLQKNLKVKEKKKKQRKKEQEWENIPLVPPSIIRSPINQSGCHRKKIFYSTSPIFGVPNTSPPWTLLSVGRRVGEKQAPEM